MPPFSAQNRDFFLPHGDHLALFRRSDERHDLAGRDQELDLRRKREVSYADARRVEVLQDAEVGGELRSSADGIDEVGAGGFPAELSAPCDAG